MSVLVILSLVAPLVLLLAAQVALRWVLTPRRKRSLVETRVSPAPQRAAVPSAPRRAAERQTAEHRRERQIA